MNSTWMSVLSQAGIEAQQALERFMNNEGLYVRFLNKFLQDKNFDGMIASANSRDYDAMLTHAHTLKGVAGNLGLAPLYQKLDTMVLRLRSQETEDMAALILELEQEYERMCRAIEQMGDKQ